MPPQHQRFGEKPVQAQPTDPGLHGMDCRPELALEPLVFVTVKLLVEPDDKPELSRIFPHMVAQIHNLRPQRTRLR